MQRVLRSPVRSGGGGLLGMAEGSHCKWFSDAGYMCVLWEKESGLILFPVTQSLGYGENTDCPRILKFLHVSCWAEV